MIIPDRSLNLERDNRSFYFILINLLHQIFFTLNDSVVDALFVTCNRFVIYIGLYFYIWFG